MAKPIVFFESRGESGNIYALLGRVSQTMNDDKAFNELWEKVQQGTYPQAIELINNE